MFKTGFWFPNGFGNGHSQGDFGNVWERWERGEMSINNQGLMSAGFWEWCWEAMVPKFPTL
jgi:hypothetical protein